jgi:hypothetical protein
VVYERVLKLATFEFVRTHLKYTVYTFLEYKPLIFFADIKAYFAEVLKDLFFIKLATIILICAAIGGYAPAQGFLLTSDNDMASGG